MPRTLTSAEFPGTTVVWGEEHFEVIAAEGMPNGGVRYVLAPWRDEHTIRTIVRYDDESEARLAVDHERARRQRRFSVLTRVTGIFLGQLPAPVQNRLGDELGVSPMRLTIASCIPPVVLLGVCAYFASGAMIDRKVSPVPIWLWLVACFLTCESGTRFFVAMSQNRAMGSLFGTIGYAIFRVLAGSRGRDLPKPFEEPGNGVFFMIPPTDDVALRDSITLRAPMLTLLSAGEQGRVARKYGFNYRQHAFGLTWTILALALLGVATSCAKVQHGRGTALISLLVAGTLAVEQIYRLVSLQRRPTGSVLGFLVRPFVRDLLREQ